MPSRLRRVGVIAPRVVPRFSAPLLSPRVLMPRYLSGSSATLPLTAWGSATEMALSRASASNMDIFTNCMLGGVLLGLGGVGVYVTVCGGSPALEASSPGVHRLLGAMVFPGGLALISTTGAGIVTASFLLSAIPLLTHPGHAAANVKNALRFVGMSLAGSFVGAVGCAAFLASAGVIKRDTPAASWACRLAKAKCDLSFGTAFFKAIACNFLVTTAIVLGSNQTSPGAKTAAVYLPIAVFVLLGLEHSVANMTLLPLAYFLGADIGPSDIAGNLLPVTLGNWLGALCLLAVNAKILPPARAAPLTLATAWQGRKAIASDF